LLEDNYRRRTSDEYKSGDAYQDAEVSVQRHRARKTPEMLRAIEEEEEEEEEE
jgi:hypothetical protein